MLQTSRRAALQRLVCRSPAWRGRCGSARRRPTLSHHASFWLAACARVQAAGLEGALRQREAEARGLREDLERAQGQHREEVAALRQEAEANEESLAEAQVSLALWLAGGFFAFCCFTGACCFSIRQCSRVACRHAETLRHGVGLPCQHCAPALGLPLSAKLQGGDWSSRKCTTTAVHPPLTCHSAAAHTLQHCSPPAAA